MIRKNFVALVVVALMVSFCGTPPETGDLRTATGEQEIETKSNKKVVITAVAVGAGAIICYFGPVVKTKCRSMVGSAWTFSKDLTKKAGDGSKKLWEGVKKPFRKKSVDAPASTTETVGDVSDAATKGKKAGGEGAGQ